MTDVTILRGISGSGKSTFARSIEAAVIVSADDFFMNDGQYLFDAKKLGQAHGQCLRRYLAALSLRAPTIVDNTNTTAVEIAPFYALAEAHGRSVEIVTITVSIATAAVRNVHNVPEGTIARQQQRLLAEVLPARWRHRLVKGEM